MPNPTDELDLDITRPFRIRWTRTDCERFEQDGLLVPGKYELIHGDILKKMPQKFPHVFALARLIEWALRAFGTGHVVGQGTIEIDEENLPEPDVAVLTQPLEVLQRLPRAAELALIIEVSDSTLRYDQTTKAQLYAQAEIVEYWIVDVNNRRLVVHREPSEGKFQRVQTYPETESLAPLAAPVHALQIRELFLEKSV